MNKLMLSCRKATELVEKKLVVGLTVKEKTQLYVHTRVCKACLHYNKQSELFDAILRNHIDQYTPPLNTAELKVSDDFKEKLISKIKK